MPGLSHMRTERRLPDPEILQLGFALLMMAAGFVSIAVSQICLGAALAMMLLRWGILKQQPPGTGLEVSAALLALWALAMIPLSTDPGTSLVFYRRFYIFSAIWVVAGIATTERRRLLLLAFSLAGALAISLYGEIMLLVKTGSLFTQRFGAMSNPMTSGSLLMIMLLMGLGFILTKGHSRRVKLVVGVVMVPILLGTILTMTRSAFLGLMVGLGVMFLLSHRRWFWIFVLAITVSLVLLLGFGYKFLPPVYARRLSLDYQLSGGNTTARLEMWQGGWQMVKARPWTGFGDRSLDTVSPDYFGDESTKYHGHLHSNFVQLAVIWGIPGLILGLLFIAMPVILLLRRWRTLRRGGDPPPVLSACVLGAAGMWAGVFIAGITEWYFGDAETMLAYFAFLGCALGPANIVTNSKYGKTQ